LFKKEEGISLTDYIVNVRINKAMEYLRDPQFTVYEVATKTGFNDEKYFSKVFKKKVGVTPTEYKEKSIFNM
jgi:two-component system response regulator YesN